MDLCCRDNFSENKGKSKLDFNEIKISCVNDTGLGFRLVT